MFLVAVGLQAQAPRFEVATLKLSPPPEGNRIVINLGAFRDGRLTLNNVTLNDAIKFAYEVVSDEQLVGPDWNGEVRFDIEGLAPPETPLAQVRLMTQDLLTDRLGLVLRREQKVLRHLALVAGRGELRIERAKSGASQNQGAQVRGKISHTQMPMSGLVTLLSRFERQTIVDATGLTGPFEVKLEWAPDNLVASGDPNAPPPDRPSLFAAVQEQLGLRLEARRAPLEVLVVERASRVLAEN